MTAVQTISKQVDEQYMKAYLTFRKNIRMIWGGWLFGTLVLLPVRLTNLMINFERFMVQAHLHQEIQTKTILPVKAINEKLQSDLPALLLNCEPFLMELLISDSEESILQSQLYMCSQQLRYLNQNLRIYRKKLSTLEAARLNELIAVGQTIIQQLNWYLIQPNKT